MNGSGQARVRVLIVARLADPDAENTLGAHARASAERDQQAVGRLTRQDALPGRSMARARPAAWRDGGRDGLRRALAVAFARTDADGLGLLRRLRW